VPVAEGDGAAAVRVLEEGLALVPRDLSLMTQLGALYLQQGKLDQAGVLLNDVVTLSPTAANARWYLSYVFEAQDKLEEAVAQVKILQERFPNNAAVSKDWRRFHGLLHQLILWVVA
jgi:Flp pilus assembly protein TadD